jgi:hypothetical protein
MLFLIFPFLLTSPITADTSACGQIKVKSSVSLSVGMGATYVYPGEWPWLAQIFNNGFYQCGASIISNVHLLTGELLWHHCK